MFRVFAWLAGVALVLATSAASAATFPELEAQVARGDFASAQQTASILDSEDGGDFFAVYVQATSLIAAGDCVSATPLLETLAVFRPSFMPSHQLLYLCDLQRFDPEAAAQRLDVMLALLPEGEHRNVIQTLRNTVSLAAGPVFSLHGDIIPSTNANRQTAATNLAGLIIPEDNRASPGASIIGGATATFGLFTAGNIAVAGSFKAELEYSTVSRSFAPHVTAELPVTWRAGALTYGVSPFFGADFDANGVDRLRAGGRIFASFQASPASLWNVDAKAYLALHPVRTFLDGTYIEASVAHAYVLTPELVLTTKLTGALDLPDTVARHRGSAEVLARLDYYGSNGLNLGASGALGVRLHNAPPPLSTGPNQVDTYAVGKAEIGHQALSIGPFVPMLYYQVTHQASDNVFFDYDSHDVGIRLRASL